QAGDLVDDLQIPGRLELDLNRQARRLAYRLGAAGDVERALVRRGGGAGGEGGVHRAVEFLGRDRDLGQHLRRLLRDGAAVRKRHPDPAERALVGVPPVGTRLDDRAGQGVQVQQGDLPVGDAVRRGEVVVAGTLKRLGGGQPLAVGVDSPPIVFRPEYVRRG